MILRIDWSFSIPKVQTVSNHFLSNKQKMEIILITLIWMALAYMYLVSWYTLSIRARERGYNVATFMILSVVFSPFVAYMLLRVGNQPVEG